MPGVVEYIYPIHRCVVNAAAVSRDFLGLFFVLKFKVGSPFISVKSFLDYVTLFVLGKLLGWLFLLVSNESYLRQKGPGGKKVTRSQFI